MADWLELTNTYLSFRTMQGVNQLAQTQQQTSAAMLSIEMQKQRDNQYLSTLVDLAVKVSEFVQDGRPLDAILSGALGIMSYHQLYPSIVNAETKMKAAELRFKFVDAIRGILASDQTNQRAHEELSAFLTGTMTTVKFAIEEIDTRTRKHEYRLTELDPIPEWEFRVGEECVPLKDFQMPDGRIMLHRGRTYPVTRIDAQYRRIFHISNEFGGETEVNLYYSSDGRFLAFIKPALPNISAAISGWQFCDRVFSRDFLDQHLKAARSQMSALYDESIHRNEECVNLRTMVNSYDSKRQEVIRVGMWTYERKIEQKRYQQKKRTLLYVKIGSAILLLGTVIALIIAIW